MRGQLWPSSLQPPPPPSCASYFRGIVAALNLGAPNHGSSAIGISWPILCADNKCKAVGILHHASLCSCLLNKEGAGGRRQACGATALVWRER